MINFQIVFKIIGFILVLIGLFMLLSLPVSLYSRSGDHVAIILSSAVTISFGGSIAFAFRQANNQLAKREGFLIVVMSWMLVSIFSMLPYVFSGIIDNFTDAIFESVSGLTTTGASILTDIEAAPAGILFWRSMTQWLGGMGIIVLTIALFPLLGVGGIELFVAETPGPTSDKIHPRIKETAKRLWLIYIGLTVVLSIILWLLEMPFIDAINHALTTMATGGFSTKNASIAFYESHSIHYTISAFMFIAGINYTLIYYGLRGNFKKVWSSEEFKTYLILVSTLILSITLSVCVLTDNSVEQSFREVTFMIVSIITTTGYVSADYTAWAPALTFIFFILFFVGACAGSTSGGIKLIRHIALFKNSILELRRLLHPRAIIRSKVDNKIIEPAVMTHILVFVLLYLMLFVSGSILMSIVLADFQEPILTSIGAVATSLSNVGPAIAQLGPLDNFAEIPAVGKYILIVLMLLGRLEIFTVLFLLTPYMWKYK